jgi:hypothetical protein
MSRIFSPRVRRLALMGVVASCLALPAASYADNNCAYGGGTNDGVPLYDSAGYFWSLESDGRIDEGSGHVFNNAGVLALQEGAGPENTYDPSGACTREEDDREVVFPQQTLGSLDVSRKVYVPAGGLPFARQLDLIVNPTAAPVTVTVRLKTSTDYDTLDTKLTGTSSGDAVELKHDVTDHWAVQDDSLADPAGATGGQSAAVMVWDADAGAARVADATPDTFADGDKTATEQYTDLTVQPGQTIAFMHLYGQRATSQTGLDAASALTAGPVEAYAGLSPEERAALQNFPADGDGDRDGKPNSADNCASVANADQANLDGDGQGDACDDDIDGDGVSNAAEAAKGSDSRKADTDGDGVADGADPCPALPGLNNGCPRFDGPADAVAPKLTVKAAKKVKAKAFRKSGVTATVTCDEACAVSATLTGSLKGKAKLAKAGDLVLATKSAGLKTGKRSLKLKPSKTLLKALGRKASLRITVVATDAAGNKSTKTIKLEVR